MASPGLTTGTAGNSPAGLGIHGLDQIVHQYLAGSLAPSTSASYRSAANRYLHFCTHFRLAPLPLQQDTIVRFAAHLASTGVSYQSIRSYLSGLRFLQVSSGFPDPCIGSLPRLEYVLRGIRRSPLARPRLSRHPLTPEMLQLLFLSWSCVSGAGYGDACMLWAACCTGFFGFMRAGEFTCPSLSAFRSYMLSPRDVTVDSHSDPSVLSVVLRRSKVDPFGTGVTIHLGRTGHAICPVSALLSYLARRGQGPGPLFLFQDGASLSKQRLLLHVRQALASHGVDASRITGHSFRIGAATAAANSGLEDSLIQTLGRWHSSAYLRYIRTPRQTLAATSGRLIDAIRSSSSSNR